MTLFLFSYRHFNQGSIHLYLLLKEIFVISYKFLFFNNNFFYLIFFLILFKKKNIGAMYFLTLSSIFKGIYASLEYIKMVFKPTLFLNQFQNL